MMTPNIEKKLTELADELGARLAIALCAHLGLPPEMRDEEELA